jgi:hypothetical protein
MCKWFLDGKADKQGVEKQVVVLVVVVLVVVVVVCGRGGCGDGGVLKESGVYSAPCACHGIPREGWEGAEAEGYEGGEDKVSYCKSRKLLRSKPNVQRQTNITTEEIPAR